MAYKVYLLDDVSVNQYTELDCETIDFSTVFAVADISDISKRKDSITKQISFKGTKVNNQAFGTMFHLNTTTDVTLDNRLFFNYNPLRSVQCLVYEDSALLLKGSLRVMEINVDKFNNVTYQTVITGSFIDFKQVLNEKLLTDLDMNDLKHRYNWNNVQNSWHSTTERFDTTTSTYSYHPFTLGEGYVYPCIDYGHTYQFTNANSDLNNVPALNFRPAVYVKTYLDKIFSQPDLAGFSYEVKGSPAFKNKFNSLIVPNADEKLRYTLTGANTVFSSSLVVQQNSAGSLHTSTNGSSDGWKLLSFHTTPALPAGVGNLVSYVPTFDNVFKVDRTFTSDAAINVNFSNMKAQYPSAITMSVQLVQRTALNNNHVTDGWEIVSETVVNMPYQSPAYILINRAVTVNIPEREFEKGTELAVRVNMHADQFVFTPITSFCSWNLSAATVSFPKDTNTPFTADITYDSGTDAFTPSAPAGIKQLDFIKSLIGQMNLYVYTTKERPKHLVFERYDDYYALTSLPYLASNALDWSGKIDYTSGFKIKSNLQIPKKYLFTYKEDSDFINANYKKSFNEVYGSFRFNDALGLTEEKKVELVFSPSPLVKYSGTGRIHPAIYAVDGANKKPTKSNIRLMFYNGLKPCSLYSVGRDNGSTAVTTLQAGLNQYPQCGNYHLAPGVTLTATEDLYFGTPKQVYIDTSITGYDTCPTGYQSYYIGQVSELTNPNVSYIECNVYLNEVDIANLDLKVPVFVDLGPNGNAYFKILSITYENNNTVSQAVLQKISFS